MSTLYERCKPREWMGVVAAYLTWWEGFHLNTFLNVPERDYRDHWRLEGPCAPEEVR